MDDTHKIIVEQKLEALETGDTVEYLVDTASLGEPGLVSCVVDSKGDDTWHVTVADGPFTGTKMSVPTVVPMDKDFLSDAASKLFK